MRANAAQFDRMIAEEQKAQLAAAPNTLFGFVNGLVGGMPPPPPAGSVPVPTDAAAGQPAQAGAQGAAKTA